MELDEQSKAILEASTRNPLEIALGLDTFNLDLNELTIIRENFKQLTMALARPSVRVGRCEDHNIVSTAGNMRIRCYWPPNSEGKLIPAVIWAHGGGWVIGDLDTHDSMLREFCLLTGMFICNVEYRLAPEHKFPAGLQDICDAIRWVAKQSEILGVARNKIALAGESAGGNIAAAASLVALEDESMPIAAQLLVSPNLCAQKGFTSKSRKKLGDNDINYPSPEQIETVLRHYIRDDSDRSNPLVSPLLAPNVERLPPTAIFTAGFDPFQEEGRQFAERLTNAGVETHYHCFETTIHGFLNFGGALDIANTALHLFSKQLRELLGYNAR